MKRLRVKDVEDRGMRRSGRRGIEGEDVEHVHGGEG
jgi:hypothetical protein